KTAACAIGTGQVPAIAAQEDPNVDLVFLALEPAEEAANAVEIARTLDHKSLLVVAQIFPRNVEANLRLLRCALEIGELRPVVRLTPRLDGVLDDGLRRIRHDEIHVELDDVAKAMTCRTGANAVVDR